MIKRGNTTQITTDLNDKVVFISGPRQSGKTTVAKMISPQFDYINYDNDEDRLLIKEKRWDRSKPLIIFDEIHKMKQWKRWVKGIYDVEGIPPKLLVTGSAKLDTYRKVGDSMAGRFFSHRLYPLDVKEVLLNFPDQSSSVILENLLITSGFPEPFLKGEEGKYKRWRKGHLDTILRQDLLDMTDIRQITAIETLIVLLRHRVGSPVSLNSLAEDLQCHHSTVKRYLGWLEELYVIFKVTPYHRNVARSLLKESKYYFYDTAAVEGSEGAKLENIVAFSLLKELHLREDCGGADVALHYLRTKDGQEVDFLVSIDGQYTLIEVKTADTTLDRNLTHFSKYFQNAPLIQLVKETTRTRSTPNGAIVTPLAQWLETPLQ